jgi:hypothetical protein
MLRGVRFAAVLLLCITVAPCGRTASRAPRCDVTRCPENLADSSAAVTYADGNGNAYVVRGGTVEYRPVTPRESSSGRYSGGPPWKRVVDAAALAEIARTLDAAIDAKASHIPNRVMMSGQITVTCGDEHGRWILAPGSKEIEAIEALMARLASTER